MASCGSRPGAAGELWPLDSNPIPLEGRPCKVCRTPASASGEVCISSFASRAGARHGLVLLVLQDTVAPSGAGGPSHRPDVLAFVARRSRPRSRAVCRRSSLAFPAGEKPPHTHPALHGSIPPHHRDEVPSSPWLFGVASVYRRVVIPRREEVPLGPTTTSFSVTGPAGVIVSERNQLTVTLRVPDEMSRRRF